MSKLFDHMKSFWRRDRKKIPKFWVGRLTGTNRGTLALKLKKNRAKLALKDQTWGSSIVHFEGQVSENRAEFESVDCIGYAPIMPSFIKVSLQIEKDLSKATGDWQTDIGTTGSFTLVKAKRFSWWKKYFEVLISLLLHRWGPTFYVAILILVASIDIFSTFATTYPTLVLLLVPAPYVFRHQLLELIESFRSGGVKRLGPLELQEQTQRPSGVGGSPWVAPTGSADSVFQVLNQTFVPQTKMILLWLALAHLAGSNITSSDFDDFAESLNVRNEYRQNTWDVLQQNLCLTVSDDRVQITVLGSAYANYLSQNWR